MPKGRVYIVKNPLFPTLFKIGFTSKGAVEDRGLNASNIPEAFEVIREYECEDYQDTEKLFHQTFESFRYYSQIDGRGKRTEFFTTACLSNAVAWMDKLKGLTDVTEEAEAKVEAKEKAEEKANKQLFDKSKIVRRPRFSFEELNISIGTKLKYIKDQRTCITIDNKNKVKYEGKTTTLSALATEFMGCPASGTDYFEYNGEKLDSIRRKLENKS